MDASGGAIGYREVGRIPIKELQYLYRAALTYLEKKRLDLVYDINLGYAGDQEKIDRRTEKIEELSFTSPRMEKENLLALKEKLEEQGVIKKQE